MRLVLAAAVISLAALPVACGGRGGGTTLAALPEPSRDGGGRSLPAGRRIVASTRRLFERPDDRI